MPKLRRFLPIPLLMLALVALVAGRPVQARDAADPPPVGDAVRGKRLMSQYQCGACHVVPGVPAARGTIGPSLENYGQRSYIAGRLVNRPELLARWIERPSALVPGTTMPDMGVQPQEARDMAAWLSGQRGP